MEEELLNRIVIDPNIQAGKTSNKRNPHTSIPNHRTPSQRPNPPTNPKRISGTKTRRH